MMINANDFSKPIDNVIKQIQMESSIIYNHSVEPVDKTFFTEVPMCQVRQEDLQQVRIYKDQLAIIRDRYDSNDDLWHTFNEELRRVVKFLLQEKFKEI